MQDARLQFEAAATKAKAKQRSGHSMLCPYEEKADGEAKSCRAALNAPKD